MLGSCHGLTSTLQWNRGIINVIGPTLASYSEKSQKVCCEKVLFSVKVSGQSYSIVGFPTVYATFSHQLSANEVDFFLD